MVEVDFIVVDVYSPYTTLFRSITLRIGGYDMKRVMVDKGSGAKIMYPD